MKKYYAIGIYPNRTPNPDLCINSTRLCDAKREALADFEADTLILVESATGKSRILRHCNQEVK